MEIKTAAINVVVLLMFVNAVPGLVVASGLAEDWGITPNVAGDTKIDQANEKMKEVRVSGGFASTLYAVYVSVTGPVRALLGILFGAPIILASVGVPVWLVDFVFVPQYLLVGGTLIYMLAGRVL